MGRNPARERGTGRYAYDGGFDRLCVCGHTLGVHTAIRTGGAEPSQPCLAADLGEATELCECDVFRPARRRRG